MIVLLWEDVQPFGPHMQLLTAVADLGEARRLARVAEVPAPSKHSKLRASDSLCAVALADPGELLWRVDEDPDHRNGFEGKAWQRGATAARDFRDDDVARYNSTVAQARERRRDKHR